MPFSILCPKCNSLLQLEDHLQGGAVQCGHCSQPMQVPRMAARPIPAPASKVAPRTELPRSPIPVSLNQRSGLRPSRLPSPRSNLVPILTWVGVIGVAAAVVVAVFVEGNRRRAERRRQEEVAKAA